MNIILKGNIIYSKTPQHLCAAENSYLVCENGISRGVCTDIPSRFETFPVFDYGNNLIIPGLCDLHTHAPQYAFRGLGASLELLEWLETYTYPEESGFADLSYAERAYGDFTDALAKSATTRACIFATVHPDATLLLMDKLEHTGIITYTGLVNMDRNCPEALKQAKAHETTLRWIESTQSRYKNTRPILTPRFIPSCSDELMEMLGTLQQRYNLPVQSHLAENISEISLVNELTGGDVTYAGAYERYGLFGTAGAPAVMAHCIWCCEQDVDLMCKNGVYVAHCPQSNMNIASGIAPVRRYLSRGIHTGLGSDVAGGYNLSIFRAISDAVSASKMYWRLVDADCKPLTFPEAFYLATAGGGSFFGRAGSFEEGYEFDAVVLDDSCLPSVYTMTTLERLERIISLDEKSCIKDKYIRGIPVNVT